MPPSLPRRQRDLYTYIIKYIEENQCSPELKEIAKKFNVKPPTAHKMLQSLIRKGYIHSGRKTHSGYYIRIIERNESKVQIAEVKTIGEINSQSEVLKFGEVRSQHPVIIHYGSPDDYFGLEIRGVNHKYYLVPGDILIIFKKVHNPEHVGQ